MSEWKANRSTGRMNEWDPDQFFGQFTVMFLIVTVITLQPT